jgi:hypothetical protein
MEIPQIGQLNNPAKSIKIQTNNQINMKEKLNRQEPCYIE